MSHSVSAANIVKQLLAALILVTAAVFMTTATAKADSLDPAQKKEMESVIREYLLNNPEVVIEAIKKYQEQEQLAQQADTAKALESVSTVFKDGEFPRSGTKDGDVLFVEFFDYQCGYCKKVFPAVMEIVNEDKNLDMVFVEFPILGEASVIASKAALASRKQGKYMDYHVALMEYRGRLSEPVIMKIATSVGLDADQLRSDMQSEEVEAHIQRNRELAKALGLRGTPAFIIGDSLAPGAISVEQMQQLIKQARANG